MVPSSETLKELRHRGMVPRLNHAGAWLSRDPVGGRWVVVLPFTSYLLLSYKKGETVAVCGRFALLYVDRVANCPFFFCVFFFVAFNTIAAAIALDHTGSVNEHHLAREERMGSRTDFHFDQWIGVAVFPFDGFFRGARRSRFDPKWWVGTDVFKNYVAVFWVNIGFSCDYPQVVRLLLKKDRPENIPKCQKIIKSQTS